MLISIGLITIYTSSSIPAAETYGDEFHFVRKQALTAGFGFMIIFLFGHLPSRFIERMTLPLLLLSILLLGLVLASPLGATRGGATRWLILFGVSIQPAEVAKLALVLFLAKNLSRPGIRLDQWTWVIPNFIVLALFAALLLPQPDFGTLALMSCLAMAMLFVAGMSWSKTGVLFCVALLGLGFAVYQAPYRMRRMVTFLDPWQESQGSGFQIVQSLLGYQNGGIFGLGLGESRQKLYFLPEAHNDFIMSVVGEELGIIGVGLICGIFIYICILGIQIAREQKDRYKTLVALGITLMITGQAFVNIGVSMGVLPTKGTALPFVSSGSSALFTFMFAIAMLARLGQREARTDTKSA